MNKEPREPRGGLFLLVMEESLTEKVYRRTKNQEMDWGKGDGQQKSKRFNNTFRKMRLSHVKSIHFISHYIFKVTGVIRSPLFVPF